LADAKDSELNVKKSELNAKALDVHQKALVENDRRSEDV
jgi:hypothetical protein